jgi:sulfur carrier protein ThiS
MRIKLSYVGYLDFKGVRNGAMVEAAEGSTLADLLGKGSIQPHHQRFVRAVVNGEQKPLAQVLREGDEVTLFLPVGGG